MKKVFSILALAIIFMVSCQKDKLTFISNDNIFIQTTKIYKESSEISDSEILNALRFDDSNKYSNQRFYLDSTINLINNFFELSNDLNTFSQWYNIFKDRFDPCKINYNGFRLEKLDSNSVAAGELFIEIVFNEASSKKYDFLIKFERLVFNTTLLNDNDRNFFLALITKTKMLLHYRNFIKSKFNDYGYYIRGLNGPSWDDRWNNCMRARVRGPVTGFVWVISGEIFLDSADCIGVASGWW
ncbi:MAG: hypothetical protein KatS3mg027_2571 [Bacteroidia bacterium]|nr:MAG: hypothetical protein KatS3mg027_2571 [Bacteroidia bacterium]